MENITQEPKSTPKENRGLDFLSIFFIFLCEISLALMKALPEKIEILNRLLFADISKVLLLLISFFFAFALYRFFGRASGPKEATTHSTTSSPRQESRDNPIPATSFDPRKSFFELSVVRATISIGSAVVICTTITIAFFDPRGIKLDAEGFNRILDIFMFPLSILTFFDSRHSRGYGGAGVNYQSPAPRRRQRYLTMDKQGEGDRCCSGMRMAGWLTSQDVEKAKKA